MDKEREGFKSKLKDVESKGAIGSVKHTELILNFEKERAQWEQQKSYLSH